MDSNKKREAWAEAGSGQFATTHWSGVLLAGRKEAEGTNDALGELCQTYWRPLYVFVRRRGHSMHDAQVLTQAFFENFLSRNYLADVSPDRGKFRTFLLACMKHFLANEWKRAQRLKRGGGQTRVSLDFESAESSFQLESVDEANPEKLYDRRWALTLLGRALDRQAAEYLESGKADMFEALKAFLTAREIRESYSKVGQRLGMTEGAVKVAVFRLRRRYREILTEEIANTVLTPDMIDEELQYFFSVLS